MKILWVKSDFLHPTTKGGHIRTLEMLRWLHRWHEVHYVAFDEYGKNEEGVRRSSEYATKAYPIRWGISEKRSARFVGEVLGNLMSSHPIHLTRPRSGEMQALLRQLMEKEKFDALVCDFLTPCLNLPEPERWVLFQHNVETMIWRRHAETSSSGLVRWYYGMQAKRLEEAEGWFCRKMRHVVAVSGVDAEMFRKDFGVERVTAVATGVDVDYFTRGAGKQTEPGPELVFIGSMDWTPNEDGIQWFVKEVLPLVRKVKSDCRLRIVGRAPSEAIRKLAADDGQIEVTGTVPDVRPHLWVSKVSIVPLRIGGGTRLKIYESMAARVPVVSTAIGAEGLEVADGVNIRLADGAADFARACVDLLSDRAQRERLSENAWTLVQERFSWEQVARQFERVLTGNGIDSCYSYGTKGSGSR
jgi:glycosyltransferase involved in cell wall biosynthesis